MKGIIRSYITGMKRHNHVYLVYSFVVADVSVIKFQVFLITKFLSQFIAVTNHRFFQIQSNNIYLFFLHLMEVIIDRKGQIGLTASKINDGYRLIFRQFFLHIFDKLQKTIDLFKFLYFFIY